MKIRLLQFISICRNAMKALLMVAAISFSSCNDDDKPQTLPEVTTAAVTDVATTTATAGGEIVSDGNTQVTASGVVYSSTNNLPVLTDSKVDATATSGVFTNELTGLVSGMQYHVRAYATNSVGTAYGNVIDFTTGNAAPEATNVLVTGTAQGGKVLTATYTYSDAEGDPESGSTFKWYVANDAVGTGEAAIAGATGLTYTIQQAQELKYIRFGVTPKSSAGVTTGAEVKSTFTEQVAAGNLTITFNYNGASVIYGILISPVTGRKWLDRNMGAPNTPTAVNDWANYGDTYQWGRGNDGHQLALRTGPASTVAVNGSTTTLSGNDVPGDALFIRTGLSCCDPTDWRQPQNDNLWQGVNGINNPCPAGFRIPTAAEWTDENLGTAADAYIQLKLTFGGSRTPSSGLFASVGVFGRYWASDVGPVIPTSAGNYTSKSLTLESTREAALYDYPRGVGFSCRCIED